MKIIIRSILILAIAFNFTNIKQAHAYLGVLDFNIQDIPQTLLQIKDGVTQAMGLSENTTSAFASYSLYSKEYFLDKVVKKLASNMIQTIQNDTIKWINSGYKGKPLFIQNPEVFYQNIYKQELARVTNDLIGATGDLRGINRQVAKELLQISTNKGNNLKKAMVPDYGGGICNKLKSDIQSLEQTLISTNASVGVLSEDGKAAQVAQITSALSDKGQQYNANCVGTAMSKDEAQKACLADFSCSGFRGIIAVVMNPQQNTEIGRLQTALNQVNDASGAKSDTIKNELIQGGGFLSQKTCEKYETLTMQQIENNVTPKCEKEVVTTPGQAAVSSLDQIIKDPTQRAQLAKEFDDALVNIASTFANKVVKDGLKSVSDGVNEFANSLDAQLANLQNSVNGTAQVKYVPQTYTNPVTGITTTTYATVTATSSPINSTSTRIKEPSEFTEANFELETQEDKDEITKPLLDSLKRGLEANSKDRTYLDKQISNYKSLMAAYQQVADCYFDKYNSQQALIRSGQYSRDTLGEYFIEYPQIIPQDFRARAAELDNIIKGLEDRKTKNAEAIRNIYLIAERIDKTMNYKGIMYYSELIKKNIQDSLFTNRQWEIKDVEYSSPLEASTSNSPDIGLYDKLANEAKSLIEPNFETTRNNRGGDERGGADSSALGICKALRITPPTGNESGNGGGSSGDGGGA